MPSPTVRHLLAAAVLAVAAVGCRLDAAALVTVDRDGAGAVGVELRVDQAMLAELDRVEVDPTVELLLAVRDAAGWELERRTDDDGGLAVTVTRAVDDPQQLTDVLRELADGLSEDDPALVVDLDLDVADDGAAELSGTATFRAPAGPGVVDDGEIVTGREAFAELTDEVVDARLVVQLPGAPRTHDADRVDAGALVWDLPVGAPVPVSATAAAPWGPSREVVVVAGAAAVLLGGGVLGWWAHRRRRATADA